MDTSTREELRIINIYLWIEIATQAYTQYH